MSINNGGTLRPQGEGRTELLQTLVHERGTTWKGTGNDNKGSHRQLHCTVLACREAGNKEKRKKMKEMKKEESDDCRKG